MRCVRFDCGFGLLPLTIKRSSQKGMMAVPGRVEDGVLVVVFHDGRGVLLKAEVLLLGLRPIHWCEVVG